ncbi:OmpA family protein [Paracoccus sp. TK19116]|uniref:OmpA family protein n=1 Tax=Paracoccus albicereus TaxID=2922394 RepID=A0ABT1MV80_9RHOB|nr:OmpA family protein [Paracoccus albicereus]MCQ0971376.1 OmpA family protein [Paracoccus albicereus]
MPSRHSRLTSALATIVALGGAGAACWYGAQAAATVLEDRSRADVRLALQTEGLDWVEVATDGLQVQLAGTAPTEADRFRAMTRAATAVDANRIVDQMDIATREPITPPDFEVELLRNDAGISLIGLVPAGTDRAAVVRRLESETAAPDVTDLLEAADYPVPDGWAPALDYGLRVAQMAPRAKVSIQPGAVSVTAITDSADEKARLQTELNRARPDGVRLAADISAPRPVIAPFTLRFLIDDQGARFDACSADTEDSRDAIVQAAIRAGVTGKPGCTIGLGSPSPDWGRAAVAGVNAVAALGAGTITIADADVALTIPASIEDPRATEVAARLEGALPPVFSLQTIHEQAEAAPTGPAEFTATASNDGTLTMQGPIGDQRMGEAVESLARARFGSIDARLRNDVEVPSGWALRVIAGIEAMAPLKNGTVAVTPDLVTLSGTSGDQQASDKITAALSQRLGAGSAYELSIRYDPRLDPTLGLPDGTECVDALNRTMQESAIGFEPNKSVIAGDAEPTLAALAETMENCGDFRIELAGHTDSQGSEGFNADLSRARAQAVLTAITEAGAPGANLTARGYGESQPIASNETEAGREANRRIEFRLLSALPVRTEPLAEPETVTGTTGAAPDPAAAADEVATAQPNGAITAEAVRAGAIALPGSETEAPAFAGPQMPTIAPAIVGADEDVAEAFTDEDENARVPVETPDDDTPRPTARPDEVGADETDDTPTGDGTAAE